MGGCKQGETGGGAGERNIIDGLSYGAGRIAVVQDIALNMGCLDMLS